jgi:hypothetical protein
MKFMDALDVGDSKAKSSDSILLMRVKMQIDLAPIFVQLRVCLTI